MLSPLLFAVLVAAIIFEFINGFHDTANAIATTVYTRALPLRVAILMSATMWKAMASSRNAHRIHSSAHS